MWVVESGLGGRAVIPTGAFGRVTGLAGAGYRGDGAVGRHLADAVVQRVRDQELAVGKGQDVVRKVQEGGGRRAAIAAPISRVGALLAGAGHRRDDAVGGDGGYFADAMVAFVGNEVAIVIRERYLARDGEIGQSRGAAITARISRVGSALLTRAGDGRDDAVGGNGGHVAD